MKDITVQDKMAPLAEQAVISAGARLYDAVVALERITEENGAQPFLLVRDEDGRFCGRIEMLDILRGLEPKYLDQAHFEAMERVGFSAQFVKQLLSDCSLFDAPLEHLCRSAAERSVKEILQPLGDGETIDAADTLDHAIHNMVMLGRDSLLVSREDAVIGVIRAADIFGCITTNIKNCALGR